MRLEDSPAQRARGVGREESLHRLAHLLITQLEARARVSTNLAHVFAPPSKRAQSAVGPARVAAINRA